MRCMFAGLLLSCLTTVAAARPYTVDDMLRVEGYGQVLVAPGGRTAMVERRDRYDGAARFTYGFVTHRATSRIMALDLGNPTGLSPAFVQRPDAGYWAGSFSPSGAGLTVFRLWRDELRLGILNVRARTVRWLPGAPDLPLTAPAPVWIDDARFVYLRFESERLPTILDVGEVVQKTMTSRWADAASGRRPSADLASTGFTGIVPRERRELVVVEAATGRERVVASGEIVDFQLAPDRRRIAATVLGDTVAPDEGVLVRFDHAGRRRSLRLIDLESGASSSICRNCDVAKTTPRFATDGRLAFVARAAGRPWSTARLYVLSRGGDLFIDAEAAMPVRLAWAGRRLLSQAADGTWAEVIEKTRQQRQLGRFYLIASDEGVVWLMDDAGLWRFADGPRPAAPVRARCARSDIDFEDQSIAGGRRIADPLAPVLRCSTDGSELVAFGFEDGKPIEITVPTGAKVLALSRAARRAVVMITDAHGVGRLFVHDAAGRAWLVDTVSSYLAAVEQPKAIPLRRTMNGRSVVDWLFLPAHGGAAPLVVYPYQGLVHEERLPSLAAPGTLRAAFKLQILTASGFAVLLPSLPAGPPTRPQDTLIADLDSAVDAAVGTGLVDPTRMAIYGHSYGGINALMIAARSDRYRAVVSANGANELSGSYGSVPPAQRVSFVGGPPLDAAIAWYETGQGQLGAAPWTEPERYRRASSLFEADRIRAPLLLISGDLDYVPVEQAEHLFVSLARLGRDVTLLRYWGEGHALQGPANIRLQWATVVDFLCEKLDVSRPVLPASDAAQVQ